MAPAHTIKTLELTIGYNKSDATFGWKGFDNALTLYYLRTRFQNTISKMTISYGGYCMQHEEPQFIFKSKEAPTKSSFPQNIHIHLLMD